MRDIFPLTGIQEMERSGKRTKGYTARFLQLGTLDEKTGMVHLRPDAWAKLNHEFGTKRILKNRPKSKINANALRQEIAPRGLGDVVASAIGLIPGIKKLPCYDAAGNLKPDSGCGKRRDALNKIASI